MTIKEALIAFVGAGLGNEASIDLALINSELTAGTTYVPATHREDIEKVSIDVLFGLFIESEREGDVWITYNKDAVKLRLLTLAKKYGRSDIVDMVSPSQPKIRGVRVW